MDTAQLWAEVRKFEEMLGRDPGAYSFAPLAELYRNLGLGDEAFEIARRGVAKYPDFAAGQMALAKICLDRKMVPEGVLALERVTTITPENFEAQKMLARLHIKTGNVAAAENCLNTLFSLAPEEMEGLQILSSLRRGGEELPTVPVFDLSGATGFEVAEEVDLEDVEEILDGDLLELTEDVDEELETATFDVFAAAPERPSLLAAQPVANPDEFILGDMFAEADAADDVEQGETESWQVTEEFGLETGQSGAPAAVSTATIAELYVEQGFLEKGLAIYRELLAADPNNNIIQNRLNELLGVSALPLEIDAAAADATDKGFMSAESRAKPVGHQGVVETLEGWLDNIRGVKECRSEKL